MKKKIVYNGVTKDIRSKKEKAKDWIAKETLVYSLPTFRPINSLEEAKRGVLRSQNGSGSCVTHALAKAIELSLRKQNLEPDEINTIISALYHYQNRSNRPQPGSSPVEMCNFVKKNGFYLEKNVKSQDMSDIEMDSFLIAKDILKQNGYTINYYIDNTPTFDEVAQYVEMSGNCMILIDTDYNNYCKDKPTPGKRGGGVRHEICVVDDVFYENEKVLFADESWGTYSSSDMGKRGQRIITKDTFDSMVEQAIYIIVSKIENTNNKIIDYSKYTTIKNIKFMDLNSNVLKLQEMLVEGGYMLKTYPINNIKGYYGTITANAVLKWQLANITSISQTALKNLGGRYFGPSSIQKIKELAGENPPATNNMETLTFWEKLADFVLVTMKSRAFWVSFIGLLASLFLALQDYFAWAGMAALITQTIASYFRLNPSGETINYMNLPGNKRL